MEKGEGVTDGNSKERGGGRGDVTRVIISFVVRAPVKYWKGGFILIYSEDGKWGQMCVRNGF